MMFYVIFDFVMAAIIFLFGVWFHKSNGKAAKFLSGYNMKRQMSERNMTKTLFVKHMEKE